MARLDLFSERNLTNSLGLYFADKLLDFGYMVYWHRADAMQTPDGLYPDYSNDVATYLANPTFAARVASSRGVVTITEGETAFPRFPTGPTTTGAVSTADRVQVPSFGIDIGPDIALAQYEFGTQQHWRVRALRIEGRARDRTELTSLSDRLTTWFDDDLPIEIEDHDGLSGELPDIVRLSRRVVTREVVEDQGEQDRFQIELNARIEYNA